MRSPVPDYLTEVAEACSATKGGEPASYIPELAKVDPDRFGIALATIDGEVYAAGDVDVLLLDKTGTITLGNRQASAFLPAQGVEEKTLADAAQLSSLADETPEGRSIVVLAKQRFNLRERDLQSLHATFVPFTAQTRMSGINIDQRMIRKGSRPCAALHPMAARHRVGAAGSGLCSTATAASRSRNASAIARENHATS